MSKIFPLCDSCGAELHPVFSLCNGLVRLECRNLECSLHGNREAYRIDGSKRGEELREKVLLCIMKETVRSVLFPGIERAAKFFSALHDIGGVFVSGSIEYKPESPPLRFHSGGAMGALSREAIMADVSAREAARSFLGLQRGECVIPWSGELMEKLQRIQRPGVTVKIVEE